MGLIYSNLRLCFQAQNDGFEFGQLVTVGRQQLFVRPSEWRRLADEFPAVEALNRPPKIDFGGYGEPMFRDLLGARQIDSIDASDYEGANLIHDLNLPVPQEWEARYDMLVDGGTLEHLFNVPVALANYLRLVKVGGGVLLFTNANNHCGHGFYQFSPELFFRVFQPCNGFQLSQVVLAEHPYPGAELSSRQNCFKVHDPDELSRRVGLVSDKPTQIMVLAKRVNAANPFSVTPQQSDYVATWEEASGDSVSNEELAESPAPKQGLRRVMGTLKRQLLSRLPASVQQSRVGTRQRAEYSLSNRDFYRPW